MIDALEVAEIRRQAVPISVDHYHRLVEMDSSLEATELISGVIVRKMTKSPLHSTLVMLIFEQLRALLPPGFLLRMEQPLTLSDSEPEPDLAVVAGRPSDFARAHPKEAALAIEVSVSSHAFDRQKAPVYAAAGIPVFWLVDAEARTVEVHENPGPRGYSRLRVLNGDNLVDFFGHSIRVREFFPL